MAGKVVDFLRNQPPDRSETDEAFGLRVLRGAVAPPVDVERMLSSVRTLAPRRPLRSHWWRRVQEALEVLASMGRVPADLPDGFPDEGPTFTGREPRMPFDAFPRLDRLVHLDLPGPRVGGHAAPALAAALVAEWLPLAAQIQRSCALLAEAARVAAGAPLEEGHDPGDVEVALSPLGLSEVRWRWKAMSVAVSRTVPRARSLWGAWRHEALIGCEALGALDQIVQRESRNFEWESTPIPPGLDVEPDLWREMDDLVVGPVLAWRRLVASKRPLPRPYGAWYPTWAHLPNPFRATAELVSLGLLPSWISPDFRIVRVLLGPPESTVSTLDEIPGWEGT